MNYVKSHNVAYKNTNNYSFQWSKLVKLKLKKNQI